MTTEHMVKSILTIALVNWLWFVCLPKSYGAMCRMYRDKFLKGWNKNDACKLCGSQGMERYCSRPGCGK